jgi:cell division protease FtsH
MDVKRYFRGPLLLIVVAVLLLLVVLNYANAGSSYQQVDTSRIVSLIQNGQVSSAKITDKNQTIQVTTDSGQQLQASWVSSRTGTRSTSRPAIRRWTSSSVRSRTC